MSSALADISLNVLLPIFVGMVFYSIPVGQLLRNHASDGFWAYALTSSVLITWKRKINFFWLFIVAVLFMLFEFLQYSCIIGGTGDIKDVLVYFIFGVIALSLNNFFKHFFYKLKIKK